MDLATLKELKFAAELYSDHSTSTLFYSYLCRLIDEDEEKRVTNKKEDIIDEITYRIKTEHKKYGNNNDLDWAEIAARKIYASHFKVKIETDIKN